MNKKMFLCGLLLIIVGISLFVKKKIDSKSINFYIRDHLNYNEIILTNKEKKKISYYLNETSFKEVNGLKLAIYGRYKISFGDDEYLVGDEQNYVCYQNKFNNCKIIKISNSFKNYIDSIKNKDM